MSEAATILGRDVRTFTLTPVTRSDPARPRGCLLTPEKRTITTEAESDVTVLVRALERQICEGR